jgi:hypothetical protein
MKICLQPVLLVATLLTCSMFCVPDTIHQDEGTHSYHDPLYGFTIDYPAMAVISTNFLDYNGLHYALRPKNWNDSGGRPLKGTPVISVILYRPTNKLKSPYPDVEIRILTRPGRTQREACQWESFERPGHPAPKLNGLNETEFGISEKEEVNKLPVSAEDDANRLLVTGSEYQVFHEGYCYALQRFMITDWGPDKTAQAYYDAHSEKIIKSFRFLDSHPKAAP